MATTDVLKDMEARFQHELERVERVDNYLRGEHDPPYTPKSATREYKLLAARSVTNWLPLIVDVMAQTLYVEGWRPSTEAGEAETSDPWRTIWQPNGLDALQSAVHRSALSYGSAYVTVLPGTPTAAVRAYSPRKMLAAYESVGDVWPLYAVRLEPTPGGPTLFLYDEVAVHKFRKSKDREGYVPAGTFNHGLGVCPVVHFQDAPDLDGRSRGQVEPLIPIQDRINQTAFDLLIAQTFGSFKVRTIAGLATPVDDAGNPISSIELSLMRFLTAEDPDVKFGQLDETNLSGYLESLDLTVRHLAAVSQTPPHALLGQMANLSAEALVAAESGLTRKTDERRLVFGAAWERVIRLAAQVIGDVATAEDTSAEVIWRDTEARSLSQTVDALGKAAQMLSIPPRALWEKIPGVSLQEAERWERMAAEGDPLAMLTATLDRQAVALEANPIPGGTGA